MYDFGPTFYTQLWKKTSASQASLGPFKYYVSMFLAFLGPPTYVRIISTVNCHFLTPPTHLFADVILEWSLTAKHRVQKQFLRVPTYSEGP